MDTVSALTNSTLISNTSVDPNALSVEDQAAADAEEQKVEFLTLLLTQLENQNPLDPLDTNEYTAQLTRYSMLEQQIETNQKLVSTNDILSNSQASASFAYIGEEVEIGSNAGVIQSGEAEWSYNVEGIAADVFLTVSDAAGNTIKEFSGDNTQGVKRFVFDGIAEDIPEDQEVYLSVNAVDRNGKSLNTNTTSHISVDGVQTQNGQTYLTAGEIAFRASDILKLSNGGAAIVGASSTSTTTGAAGGSSTI